MDWIVALVVVISITYFVMIIAHQIVLLLLTWLHSKWGHNDWFHGIDKTEQNQKFGLNYWKSLYINWYHNIDRRNK